MDGEFEMLDVSMLDLVCFEENRLIQEYNVIWLKLIAGY